MTKPLEVARGRVDMINVRRLERPVDVAIDGRGFQTLEWKDVGL